MKHHEVVAAIIKRGDEFLCLQRGPSKYAYISEKWEFPGGKVEAGETQQEALRREIQEELGLDILVGSHILTVEHIYPDFEITMHGLLCTADSSDLTLHEHIAYCWLPTQQLHTLDWAAADLPIVAQLQAPA
ncbi:(deoxy)nucleoside triphosphate pyrophosphohydrolase [Hymenobacter actinosclerus]|uniref:8-oxo-dGTP diphosphatase n=1 Tax=Hymenobacter actinosclerus TaxID=82805 RepID=A0A1I0IP20_9BACT|nr:(deoxy)nucleoside triphosphate pyrophosphohydrolase [Hymenobacter actinosclerus]SET98159.1 8-oxo-dGTP diphosphatase [Hymenobacter actinosclerus]